MRRFAVIMAVCMPNLAAADWVRLSGAEITAALEGRILRYETAAQDFRASGKTLYTSNGRDSWGNWRVDQDQYCSQWPPQDLWACYDLERQGAQVRFVGEQGDMTDGTYVE